MQKHKKQVDGLSDSSSIGSIMDDTDREVSNLTDRSFRSLCIAEEDNINHVISQSPDMNLQFSRKLNGGSLNHAFQNSNIFNKYSLQTKEHVKCVSTFKQLPRLAHEEKDDSRYSNSDTLSFPAPDPKNKKQRSKVSSLIKTFDNIENEHPWSSPSMTRKLCMPKSSQKFKSISEKECDPRETTTVTGMHKELSEFSHACQENYWLNDKYNKQRRKLKKEVCHVQDSFINAALTSSHIPGSNVYNVPQKTRKHRAEGDKELTNQSNFLHSENSAFKSWSDHSRKVIGKEEYSDCVPTKEFLHWCEDSSPLNVISLPVHKTLSNKSAMGTSQEKEPFMKVGSSKSRSAKSLMFSKPEKGATRKTGPPLALHSKTVNSGKQIKEVVMDVSSSPPPPPPPPPQPFSRKKTTASCQEKNALKDISYSHSAPSSKYATIPMVTNKENEILMDVDHFLSPSLYSNTTMVLNQEQDISLNKNSSPSLLSTKKAIVQNQEMVVPMGLSASISHSKNSIVPHLEKEVFMDVGSPISSDLCSNKTTNVGQGKDVLMNEMSSLSTSFNKRALITNQEKDVHVGESFSLPSSQVKKIIAKNQEKKAPPTNADYSVLTSPVVKRPVVAHREHEDNMDLGFSSLTKNASKNSNMISSLKPDIDMAGGSESAAAPFTNKLMARKQVNKAIISEVTSSSESSEMHCVGKPFSSELKDELGNNAAPWRRPKVIKTLETSQEISNEKQNLKDDDIPVPKQDTVTRPLANQVNMQTNWTESDSLSFNITQLLTPVIQRKHTRDSLEDQTALITPPLAEMATIKEQECRDATEYKSRDNYKSKAPSLLFNLKDVRKRVKSTYSTSPLLKNMEEKNKFRENVQQDNVKSNFTTLNLHEKSNEQDGIKSKTAHLYAMQNLNSQEDGSRNGKTDMNRQVTDNYLTLSSPQTTEDNLFYHHGDNLQEYPTIQETFEDIELNKNVLYGQQTNHQNLRKWVDYPSLKLYKKDNRKSNVEQHMKRSQENSQLQVSDVQDYTIKENNEQQSQDQNINASALSNISLTDDIHFDEKQIALLGSNDNIAKGSVHSSKQPYLNLADKIYLEQEEQKYFIERQMGGEREKHVDTGQESKEKYQNLDKDELQYYALSNCSTKIEDRSEIKESQNESQECSRDSELLDKQEDNCLNSLLEKSIKKGSSSEVPQRTCSASLKPNMFTVKDITYKSPPVIKAVKLPLLRSMSDDSIICGRKKIESQSEDSVENEKSIFRELQGINENEREHPLVLNVKSHKTKQMTAHRLKSASKYSKPVIRTPFLEDMVDFSLQNLKEDVDESREVHSLLESARKHNEEGQIKNRNKDKPDLIKAKCSSFDETTTLKDNLLCTALNSDSEYKVLHGRDRTLLNQSLILKNKISDEVTSSPRSSALEDLIYSPVTSRASDGIHFTDANSLSDDVAYTTVISPMSESISYSIVPNPVLEKFCFLLLVQYQKTYRALVQYQTPSQALITEPTSEIMSYSLTTRSASENTTSLDRASATAIPEDIEKLSVKYTAPKTKGIPARKIMLNDTEGNKVEHEHSHRIDNTGKMSGKPPTVPPKTEKALRRAKRLNNKRRKTEAQRKHTENTDASSVLRMPSPPPSLSVSSSPCLVRPHSAFTPTDHNVFNYADTQTTTPTPFPMTQRKLLQDPDSGQYFVVDIPVQVHLKTFYDPETGKYIQMSVPSSGDNLSRASSSEVLNNPYVVCPSLVPLPVTSLTTVRPSSQLSAPATLMLQHHKEEARGSWNHDHTYSEHGENQPYIEPVRASHSQHIKGTPHNLVKDFTGSRGLDIISTGDLDDFATEGIS
ncbi:LOW QUALITY PROTEIN: cardiac-enriched FHL2-interacting protein [Microcaecilia unicolor]|uniref:LOW QUALITY PROTEIN: cardiac-enriched FHL2-interacting protein n=1 Tax=Microcaecilia unicolor TaxID=1415580 RepID=A0A6P7Y2G6_9AMPH|nr:LOW QUALITY PROTEIN: cardiac-enriched FHL2-interacting protein [Microcaecilia unicolor]